MARLPLRRVGFACRRDLRQAAADRRRLLYPVINQAPIVVRKETYDLSSQTMSSILAIVIYLAMIVVDSVVDAMMFYTCVDLSRSCVDLSKSIYNLLVIVMIYLWIKSKLKVLIYLTIQKTEASAIHWRALQEVASKNHAMA